MASRNQAKSPHFLLSAGKMIMSRRPYIFLLIIGFLFFRCDLTESIKSYNLTTVASPKEGGTISHSNGTYSEGTQLTLRAVPATGWRFIRWVGDLNDSSPEYDLVMNRDISVVAVFAKSEYSLNISVVGQGSVTEELVSEKTNYESGAIVLLTAHPEDGWVFDRWEGDLTGRENPEAIRIEDEKSVTAVFKSTEASLTSLNINIVGQGNVSEEIISAKTDYETGTMVKLTAKPEEGWQFDRWEGDLSGNDNPATIMVDHEKSVTAVFKSIEASLASLTITIDGQGRVTEETVSEKTSYDTGTRVKLNATPEFGWIFERWEGDISGNKNPVTITVDKDMAVTAIFRRRSWL